MPSDDETKELQNHYRWITIELFQNILTKEYTACKRCRINVTNIRLKAALKLGENYASQMIRATVSYTKERVFDF